MSRLQGIFTPNLVPYDQHGEIHEDELRRYVDWLIERGVHGLYPNGSTGEFTRFTVEERRRIVAIIADQTRGRVPRLAGSCRPRPDGGRSRRPQSAASGARGDRLRPKRVADSVCCYRSPVSEWATDSRRARGDQRSRRA